MKNALFIFVALTAFAVTADFQKTESDWRAHREASLKSPNGWLSVAGLYWFHDRALTAGSDPKSDIVLPASAPRHIGTFRLQGKALVMEPVAGAGVLINGKAATRTVLKPDTNDHPDIITAGKVTLMAIDRVGNLGLRLRDPDAATRRGFVGCSWFPASEKWRIEAKWVPATAPKKLHIVNILGMADEEDSPGYAEFTIAGKTLRLQALDDDGDLSFLFRDETSGKATYPPGRFLDAAKPKDGKVILDFNQAYNPPCAFTAYATCPLPPRDNILTVAIEAGEKKYAGHPEAGSH